jgi:hypothetical protein
MSEESKVEIEELYETKEEYAWPPSTDQIMTIASSALNQSHDKDVKVLVYWDNPKLMIFNPFHFAPTEYVNKKYEHHERTVEVIIGKQD